MILFYRGLDRRILLAPVRNEFMDADRVNHCAGQNMRADLGSFLNEAYRNPMPSFDRELLQAEGGRKTRGATTDNNDVISEAFRSLVTLITRPRNSLGLRQLAQTQVSDRPRSQYD